MKRAYLAYAKQRPQNIILKCSLVPRMLGEQERLQLAQHGHHIGRAAESSVDQQAPHTALIRSAPHEKQTLPLAAWLEDMVPTILQTVSTPPPEHLPGGGISSIDCDVVDTQPPARSAAGGSLHFQPDVRHRRKGFMRTPLLHLPLRLPAGDRRLSKNGTRKRHLDGYVHAHSSAYAFINLST